MKTNLKKKKRYTIESSLSLSYQYVYSKMVHEVYSPNHKKLCVCDSERAAKRIAHSLNLTESLYD